MDTPDPMQPLLDALRQDGAWRLDPVRFRYIEALARRLAGQPEAVRRLLQDKLRQAVADYAQRHAQARAAGAAPRPARRPLAGKAGAAPGSACLPLSELNAHIRGASQALRGPAVPGAAPGPMELASVRRFRQAWSRQRTLEQVARAATRKPANAGPLNSHALALQSLALMQALSPDYLRRFVLQVESLQWLEQAARQYPATAGKAGKPGKAGPGGKAAGPSRRGRAGK